MCRVGTWEHRGDHRDKTFGAVGLFTPSERQARSGEIEVVREVRVEMKEVAGELWREVEEDYEGCA